MTVRLNSYSLYAEILDASQTARVKKALAQEKQKYSTVCFEMKSIVSKVSSVFSAIGASFVNLLRLMHVISGVRAVKLAQETPESKAMHRALAEEFQAIVEANKPLAGASKQEGVKVLKVYGPMPKGSKEQARTVESSVDTTSFSALYFANAKKNGVKVNIGVQPAPRPVLEHAEPIVLGKVAPRTWSNVLTFGWLGHR